jgi:pilus assembly protein CpaE
MATQVITVVILSKDLDDFNSIRAALNTDSRAKLISGGNDAEQVYEVVTEHKPSAAIISLSADGDQAIKLIQRLNADCPNTAIISAAKETSADLILQSLRSGAKEFLRLPVDSEELKTVFDQIAEFCADREEGEKKAGRMISVFSSKGGCGTSFIATNIACATGSRTVIVDLNLESGELPLFLGVGYKYTIEDLCSRHGKIDDRLISSFVSTCSQTLDLLAAPREVDPVEKIKPEYVLEALNRLSECYDFIILDLPHTYDPITLAALDQSDQIVLVTTLDIPSLRSAQRALQNFERAGYPRNRVRVLVNRWNKRYDVDQAQVEKFFEEPVMGLLPEDYQTVVNSINLGKPLVKNDPGSKVSREILRITRMVSGETASVEEEIKPKRSWNFFLKGQWAEKG